MDPSVIVTINATRADGQSKSYFGTVNEGHTITVPITYWMLELDDAVSCDVSLVDPDGNRLTTMSFTIWVEPANFGNGETEEGKQQDILVIIRGEIQDTRKYAENLNKGTLEATVKVLGTKVDKFTDPHVEFADLVYGQNYAGDETVFYHTSEDIPETIVSRDAKGRYAATDPVNPDHVVNKRSAEALIANLVNSSPEALDTLKELADALGNDPNFAATVAEQLGKKLDKVTTAGAWRVYGIGGNGSQTTYQINGGAVPGTIIYRENNGDVKVQDPISETSVTNRRYVDNTLNSFFTAGLMHKNYYRGTNLGSSFTNGQLATIQSGVFENMFVGDYWNINGVLYMILDFDYYYNTGDTPFQTHHLVVAPYVPVSTAKMNTTRTSSGGYALSDFRATGRHQVSNMIHGDFNDCILTYKNLFVNEVSTEGIPATADWYDATVELMSEQQVYGSRINGVQSEVNARRTLDTQQFAAFRLNTRLYKNVHNWWLRDVVSDKRFAAVGSNGLSLDFNADSLFGVRPYFLVG